VADLVGCDLRGPNLGVVRDRHVQLFHVVGHRVEPSLAFEMPTPAMGLLVDEQGRLVVAGDREAAWVWRPEHGVRELMRRTGARDSFGFGLIDLGDEGPVVFISHRGRVRGLDRGLKTIFDANGGSLAAFRFVELAQDLVGVTGYAVSGYDQNTSIITVPWRALMSGSEALAVANSTTSPICDRAWIIALGPAPGPCAAVFRDHDGDEPPEPDEDPAEVDPLWGFRGFYVTDQTTGAIVDRLPYAGPSQGARAVVATARRFALHTNAGLALVDRATGAAEHVAGDALALDVHAERYAVLRDGVWTIHRVDDTIGPSHE
jgi:hypothetical protein